MTSSVWKLDGTTAEFDDGQVRARVDLLEPFGGLHGFSIGGRVLSADDRTLGVDIGKVAADDLSLPETYARVDDLVVTYLQTAARPFRLQAYWRRVRLKTRSNVTAIELQVSINTSLLDTQPSVPVVTRIGGAPAPGAGQGRYALVRTPGGWSYFEAAHPGDERRATNEPSPTDPTRTHVLFGGFLEKGVIVRARVRAAFLPGEAAPVDVDALYEEFVAEPLPLTT